MAATELGVKVLATIENLISQIDRPAHLSSIRRTQNIQSMQQGVNEFDKYKVYSKMSYKFRKTDKETNKILMDRVYEDEKQFQKFRVKNRTTLKILQKNNIKPIHERTNEIVAKKDIFVRYQKQQMEQQQKQSMKPLHLSTEENLSHRKYNQSDLEFYRCEIDERNKERIKRRNMSKLHLVKRQELQIPSVNTISRSLSSKRNVKKNYSENVFQRMMQYTYELNSRKIDLMEKRRKEEGNFEPVLCSKSMVIAQKLKKAGINISQSFHHHSNCQLHSPNAKSKTPYKAKPPKQLKQSVLGKQNNKSNEKSPIKQKVEIDASRSVSKQKISSSKCVNKTPLVQKKLNSTGTFTIKPKEVGKKQVKLAQSIQDKKESKSKIKQVIRKK